MSAIGTFCRAQPYAGTVRMLVKAEVLHKKCLLPGGKQTNSKGSIDGEK